MIRHAVRLKFCWDLGQSFLSVAQFVFVVVAASDKLERVLGLSFVGTLTLLLPLALGGVLSLGWILDRLRYLQHYQTLMNDRNPAIQALLDRKVFDKNSVKTNTEPT